MPATYEPIATTTLGSAAASVTFSSISGAYTDLVLVCNYGLATTNTGILGLKLNADNTASNYSSTYLQGNGSTASSSRYTGANGKFNVSAISAGSGASSTVSIIQFQNYANTTTYKTWVVRNSRGETNGGVNAQVSLWRNTAAITQIVLSDVETSGLNLVTGSTFTLYGIKAA